MVELLAPAGDMESLKAAVLNGADAIYLGGKEFSARQSAANFDREELIGAVKFCHAYGVKVYVTINTLLKNQELKGALEYASFLYSIGVDAIIIQDLGLLHLLKKHLPEFEVHASTQMTAHNLDAVNKLYELGIKRVVLSRELSLDEIKYIKENTNAELEMFVHGALCICFSGQCLMSSLIGGRSGNRGRCAQPCRLEYRLDGKKAYHLSPKDLSTLDFVEKIKKLGVYSLKIEGRMKRPEYVATVVSAYRSALDGKLNNKQKEDVTQIFNRGGFTSAFMFNRQGYDMMSYKKPRNWGTYLGKVIKVKGDFVVVRLDNVLNEGDGVEIFDRSIGVIISNMKLKGKVVKSANKGDEVDFYLKGAKVGDVIYKTSDADLLKRSRESFEGKEVYRIPLDADIKIKKDENIRFKIRDIFGTEVEVIGSMPEVAKVRAISVDKVKENLSKTKDTPYVLNNLTAEIDDDITIPVSQINALRREAIDKLLIIKQNKKEYKEIKIEFDKADRRNDTKLILATGRQDIIEAVNKYFDEIYFGGDKLRINNGDIFGLIKNGYNVFPWIPEIVLEEENNIKSCLDKLEKSGIKKALCGNLGIYSYLDKKGFDVLLDKGFNVFNSFATKELKNKASMVSLELNLKEIKDLLENTDENAILNVYGRTKLMVSRQCFIGSFEDEGKKGCPNVCKNNIHYLKDRKNEEFLIIPDYHCRNHIYNSKVLSMLDNIDEVLSLKPNYILVNFVDEDVKDAIKISSAFKKAVEAYNQGNPINDKEVIDTIEMLKGKVTKGHYYRGVL